jgi:nucleoside-diphosphate-sugar epimerase
MEILITGGTGFLGEHLARALLGRGHRVRILGRDFTRVSGLLDAGAQPVRADLRDFAAVVAACDGVDAVYHLGALTAAWGSAQDFHAINVGGTAAVLEGCRRHGAKRLIYVSSPSVLANGRDQRDLRADTPYPRKHISPYALTKRQGEDLVNDAPRGVATVIVRPGPMFGPGDRGLLPRLIAAARARRLVRVGGKNLVELTYVENVAEALAQALDARAAARKTYHISNGEPVVFWDTLRDALTSLGIRPRLLRVPVAPVLAAARALELRADRSGKAPPFTRTSIQTIGRTQTLDIAAARRDLGYAPRYSVAEGMRRTLLALGAQDSHGPATGSAERPAPDVEALAG